jgi:hypothetical protein
MPRCQKCNKKSSILLECRACQLGCCSRCIDMSIHNCIKVVEYSIEKRKTLENNLMNNKTQENKRLHGALERVEHGQLKR